MNKRTPRSPKTKLFAIALCLALLGTLCACGSTDTKAGTRSAGTADYSNAGAPAVYYAEDSDSYDYSGTGLAAGNTLMSSADSVSDSGSTDAAEADSTEDDLNPEKIIYSGSATVETTEFDTTLQALQDLVDTYGGWIESSSVNGARYSSISSGRTTYRSASYTIRVPHESFSEVMSSLSALGNVPYSYVYSENVTSQYYDTQARLKTYEAQEQRLVELLEEAENVSDVIEIENELTEVRYRIESQQTALQGWDRRVSWSTIDLSINEVSEYTPAVQQSYGSKLLDALGNGVDALGDFLLALVEALPTLLVLAAIVWGIVRLVILGVRKGRARRAKKNASPVNGADSAVAGEQKQKNP